MQKDSVQVPRFEDAEHGTITAKDKNDCFSMTTRKKAAFTLAEVLITLMIIGVIAMIVVPGAIQKANDRADVARVKKDFSVINNALRLAITENGYLNEWTCDNTTSTNKCRNQILQKYVNLGVCPNRNCFNFGYTTGMVYQRVRTTTCYYMSLNGQLRTANGPDNDSPRNASIAAFALANGTHVTFSGNHILIDINGDHPPGRYGYDIFRFGFSNAGNLYNQSDTSYFNNANNCTKKSGLWQLSDGVACSTWILKHNNMDYKYRDVSAEW